MVVKMIITLLAMVGGVLGLLITFPFLANALARHNLFFTLVEEGEAKNLLHNRAFIKVVMKYHGFYVDERWNVKSSQRRKQMTVEQAEQFTETLNAKRRKEGKKELKPWDGKERREKDSWWLRIVNKFMGGGLIWVGIPPFDSVHTYEFRWQTLKEGKVVFHEELLDYVFVKSAPYFVKLEEVETKGMVPLNIEMLLTIRCINPYKTIFRVHQWLEFAVGRLGSYIRQYVPARNIQFENLIGTEQLPGSDLFQFLEGKDVGNKLTPEDKQFFRVDGLSEKEIEEKEQAGWGILKILREIYGIDITGIEFRSIVTVGKQYEEAAAKKWSAKRDRERIIIEAEAEAKKIKTIADAEAERIRTVSKAIQDCGNAGLVAKVTDMIKDSAAKLPNWIILPGDFLDIFKKFGGKDKEGGDKQ